MSANIFYSYIAQAAGALFTAVLFGIFSRTYEKPFLLHWARSWSAMCIMLAAAAIGTALTPLASHVSPSRLTVSTVAAIAAYMQVAWLLLGAHELAFPAAAERFRPRRPWLFAAAVLVGIASVAAFATDPDPRGPRFLARVGLRAGVMGIAFLLTAIAVWWPVAGTPRRGLGRSLAGGSALLFGLSQLHMLGALLLAPEMFARPEYSTVTGFLGFVLMLTMGLGVVIWLLEEEHERASVTASEIEQLAFHDPLTGLQNRKLFLDHLARAIIHARRDREKLALFFIDLDRFKVVNDSLGHSAGDRVLQAAAARLTELMREGDAVGRMGGDEFVILAPRVHGVADAVHIAQKVRDALRAPLMLEGREIFVTGSMGVALYPDDGDDAESLLKNADTAMYRAKAQGSDMFQLYTPEMNVHAVEQLALESALRRAVQAREFELHYQPIVQMSDNHICTLEMMLRWRHPVLGLVRPEQFIALAETSGLIVQIGEWALRVACGHLAEWRAAGYPGLRLAVNISARQLRDPDFADKVRVTLAETGVAADALELEISEMSASQSEAFMIDRLRALRALGIRISIDDFGTGFSSVSALRAFPVDALKIDTSFVRDVTSDPNDAAVAGAVVALAKAMALTVVAEGVENPAQLDFLRAQGCEMWQGYLCCPPVPYQEVRAVLGRRSGGHLAPRSPATPQNIGIVR